MVNTNFIFIDKVLNSNILLHSRHNCLMGVNLHRTLDPNVLESCGEKNQLAFTNPLPLSSEYVPLTRDWTDIGTEIVKKHLQYQTEVKRLKEKLSCNKKLSNMWKATLKKNELNADNIYPDELIEYTKLLELSPDSEFNGFYNWFLTGSNLATVHHNDQNLIVKPFGSQLNHIDIIPFKKSGKRLSNNMASRYDLNGGDAIYEVAAKSNLNELIVAARNRHHLKILRHKEDPSVIAFDSKPSYVSMNLSDDLRLASVDIEKRLKIYDLNTGKTVNKFDLEYAISLRPDSWSCVRNFRPEFYIYADRRNIRVIDSRTKVVSSNFNLSFYGEYCEYISCMQPSQKYENLVYASTNHKLFAIDLRNFSGEIDEKNMAVAWPILTDLPPTMIKTTEIHDSELIVLSSHLSVDKRAVLLEKDTDFKSLYLPIQIPNMFDTHTICKEHGTCLNPVSSVVKRIKSCITGIDFTKTNKGKISLISLNSSCDLFKQDVINERNCEETKISKMESWMKNIDEQDHLNPETKTISVTAMLNKEDLVRVLRSKRITRPTDMEEEISACKPKRRPPWQKTPTELSKYKDALVNNIMEIWDLPVDPDDTTINLPLSTEPTINERINSWLEKTEYTINDETTEAKVDPETPMDFETPPMDTNYTNFELSCNIFQTSTQEPIPESQTLMTPPQLSQKSTAKRTNLNRSKKKYSMGF